MYLHIYITHTQSIEQIFNLKFLALNKYFIEK